MKKPIEIDMKEVVSSNITKIGFKLYDDSDVHRPEFRSGVLRVQYKYGLYDYSDVTEVKYKKLLESDSIGKFIAKFIKGVHPFVKLTGTGFGGYA